MANVLLQSVDFIRADGKLSSGLVSVKGSIPEKLTVDEQSVVVEAKTFKHFKTENNIPIIDYVFFRRFSDGRSSQVAAYVVDNSDDKLDKKTLSELHRQVWLQGTVPLLYIAGTSQIDILACAREPDFWDENKRECKYNPAKILKKDLLTIAGQVSDEIKKFSAIKLANGTFWDDPGNRKLANYDKAVYQSLIQAIVDADNDIDGENNPLQRRLLLLMVLIKYLEDRKVFPIRGWFGKFHKGAKSFFEVLKSYEPEKVNRLLEFLADKFNGDVFDIKRFSPHKLTKKTLETFANFVEARTLNKQRYLWDQYSFEHLPVEIISHLYQRFIKDGHGAVYTPPFLAALLLDYTMPYKKMTGKERILDPACGSGVFLVGAFKRLINLWRSKNGWKNPSVEKLKETLRRCIYGIDLDRNAIDLTAFSLSLAICDALRPNVIWNELKFDYLCGSNLFETDFFDSLLNFQNNGHNMLDKKFDIVIGNPPFESKLTEAGKEIDKIAKEQDSNRGKCPDNQIAYLFLEQALTVLKPNSGRVCLIQPAGLFYNRNPHSFRSNLFKKYCVNRIFDFISIRNMYAANKQTVAVFARSIEPTEDHQISHWTFRRTISVKEKICFELDHYDCHYVMQKQAETDFYVWRINLLGGGRLLDISKRFRDMRTLEKYIRNQPDWKYGEGFTIGNKKYPAPFLRNKKYLPKQAFNLNGIDEEKIENLKESKFERPRQEGGYAPPLILISKVASLPIAYWDKYFLSYSHEIVGIHAPSSQATKLARIYKLISKNNIFFRFMLAIHGSCALTERETAILKRDIDLLPYPKDKSVLSSSFWEKVIQNDVLKYMTDYIRLGQNSELLQKNASHSDLLQYSDIFVNMFESIYDNLKASNPIFLNGLICQPFYFGNSPELAWLDRDAETVFEKLIYYDNHAHLRTVRVFRFYDKNVLLIVKPDRLRYWIRSTAIRDADETLTDLYHQGY
ncbi:MAG: N-6 DNA methylase [Planctomycetes bacterium]|nr:N-6 DNA methylase [Planctomycetota bacterium]